MQKLTFPAPDFVFKRPVSDGSALPIGQFQDGFQNVDWVLSLHSNGSITDDQLENWKILAVQVRHYSLTTLIHLLGIDGSRTTDDCLDITVIFIPVTH